MYTNDDIEKHHESDIGDGSSDEMVGTFWNVRSLFISDVHLGSDMSNAVGLIGLLNNSTAERIYILGDGFDPWSLGVTKARHFLPMLKSRRLGQIRNAQAQLDVIQKLLRKARKQAFIYYQGGNHDSFVRQLLKSAVERPRKLIEDFFAFHRIGKEITSPVSQVGRDLENLISLGRIYAVHHLIHRTADNRHFLTMHGDEFDGIAKNRRWLEILGTKLRDRTFALSEWLSDADGRWPVRAPIRRLFGIDRQFSLVDHVLAHKTQADAHLPSIAVAYVRAKNEATLRRQQGDLEWRDEPLLDGVILGHNHSPALTVDNDITYANCGDWLNPAHNTAIIEHHDGKLELVRWDATKGIVPYQADGDAVRPVAAASVAAVASPDIAA